MKGITQKEIKRIIKEYGFVDDSSLKSVGTIALDECVEAIYNAIPDIRLPETSFSGQGDPASENFEHGYNSCREEVKKLNGDKTDETERKGLTDNKI